MTESDYDKLIIEQYKIMVSSTEKVTDARQKANAFFLTIITSIISLSFFIGKEFYFHNFAVLIMIFLSVVCLLLTVFWFFTITSYRQLNKGKFQLIFELEEKLKNSLYEREWKILKSGVGYRETSSIEKYIVFTFGTIILIKLIVEILFLTGIFV
jgi:hypothetical protein